MQPKPRVHAGSLSAKMRRAGFHIHYSGETGEGIFVEQMMFTSRISVKLASTPDRALAKAVKLEDYLSGQGYQLERKDRRYPVIDVDRQGKGN